MAYFWISFDGRAFTSCIHSHVSMAHQDPSIHYDLYNVRNVSSNNSFNGRASVQEACSFTRAFTSLYSHHTF